MYSLLESLRSAFTAVRAHAFRSFLTTLGIIIGVMAVIAVVSLIQGFSSSITVAFKGFGANDLRVTPYNSQKDQLAGKVARVTPEDMLAIQHDVAGISHVTPLLIVAPFAGAVQYQAKSSTTSIYGTTAQYFNTSYFAPSRGRAITPEDDLQHRRVVVIGQTLIQNLHLPADPMGQYIEMYGEWFRVVGVLNKFGQILGFDQDNRVYIPYGTARSLQGAATKPSIFITITVNDSKDIDRTVGEITDIMRRQHKLKADQDNDFKVQTSAELASSISQIFNLITVILGGIVSISLLVGGIGIMNIMLVSVTERTREIGILKSLGARRSDILLQFLIEAVTLSLIGGVIGVALGYGIGSLVAHAVPTFRDAYVPWWAVVVAFGFSAGTGVVFGIVPAAKAAALDPIEALRYE